MLSSTYIIERKKLKELKVCIENLLFQRYASITNHGDIYRCGGYYLRGVKISCRFDHIKNSNLPEDTKLIGADNVQIVNVIEN